MLLANKGILCKKNILNSNHKNGVTIMVFAEGTILKPKSRFSLYNHKNYLPIGNAVGTIETWNKLGANIIYCTSRKKSRSCGNCRASE